ncbi:hypothetical protein TorRG33x02_302740 [Trema orientale]|uniref:Uncharacterized protein n=1 Tax=Trema orientale TaxID=63057 RepID=A0A2P5C016_TREOI|nr:hypothetical protein TorRG33x02_302740 [Trema orientale]
MGPDFKHRLRVEGEDFYKIVRVMINERSRTKDLSRSDWDALICRFMV